MFYDFNEPDSVPQELMDSFDMVVIDPPFITREVWEKYAATAKLLMKKGVNAEGRLLGRSLAFIWMDVLYAVVMVMMMMMVMMMVMMAMMVMMI